MPSDPDFDPDALIACPTCDLLYTRPDVPCGGTARCKRCHTVLLAPRQGAVALIVSFSAGALILMVAAISTPFLAIEASGFANAATVLDSVQAFAASPGEMVVVSALVALLIVVLPLFRLLVLLYTLLPLALNQPVPHEAPPLFRLAMRTRQWAMAEIFIIGVAVALIKIQSLADVSLGPAFFAFAGFVGLMAAKDLNLCERTIWQLLDAASAAEDR